MAQAQLDLARASSGTSVIKDGNPTAFEEAVVLEQVVVGDGVNSSWIAADH